MNKCFELSNISVDDDILDNLFSIDFGSWFKTCGGRLELMSIYLGSLFGFLNGWYDAVFKLNVTSRWCNISCYNYW